MGPQEYRLRRELERHWLRWRDYVINEGGTSPFAVRSALVPKQHEWEAKPDRRFGGKSPLEVVLEERKQNQR